ncbi:MAG: phospholipase D family protein [Hyphomicrobiaceae bacterium]
MPRHRSFALLAASVLCAAAPAFARWHPAAGSVDAFNAPAIAVPAAGRLEVGFSPNAGAEQLVLRVIGSAQREIRILAYTFTSARITAALRDARHRGVAVSLVVDHKANLIDDRSGRARHALAALANAGCRIRTISAYSIHHDKVIIADARTVETGSFNYSDAAAYRNSENVLVNWNNPALARIYLEHWQRRFAEGEDYRPY